MHSPFFRLPGRSIVATKIIFYCKTWYHSWHQMKSHSNLHSGINTPLSQTQISLHTAQDWSCCPTHYILIKCLWQHLPVSTSICLVFVVLLFLSSPLNKLQIVADFLIESLNAKPWDFNYSSFFYYPWPRDHLFPDKRLMICASNTPEFKLQQIVSLVKWNK